MSDAGWFQLALLVCLLAISTRLLGAYLAAGLRRWRGSRRPRSSSPSSASSTGPAASTPPASRPGRSMRARCWRSASSRCWACTRCSALQGVLPLNPTDAAAVPPALAFNTAVSFVTNTNWQNYGGELDDEPPHPDGRPDGAELRVGRGRAGGRDRLRPRTDSRTRDDDRQLLGRSDARDHPRPAAALGRARARARQPGRRPEPPRLHRTQRRSPVRRSRSPAARSPARRRSRSSARTAAARTTRTRHTRSRTRRASRTCSRSSRSCASRSRSPTRSADSSRTSARAGWSSPRCSRSGSRRRASRSHFEQQGNPSMRCGGRRGRQHGGQGDPLRRSRRPGSSPPRPPARRRER